MAPNLRRWALCALLIGLAAGLAFSEDNAAPEFKFNMDLGLGVQTYSDGTYQSIALSPEIAVGKFGIGLALALNYTFESGAMAVRQADWLPIGDVNFQTVLALYLSKIMYIRWGEKGDPLYAKLGSFDDTTLGNGFVMGGYSNTLFLPDTRNFGMNLDIDGRLFGFPFVGVETMIGNLALLDVMGARLYVRPLAATGLPILANLEVGGTYAVDRMPYYYKDPTATANPVSVYGGDLRLPIVYIKDIFSLVAFGDADAINCASKNGMGGMTGFGGKLLSIFTYGAQLRFIGDNFIPVYFDATYDLNRADNYDTLMAGTPGYIGWMASIGTSLFNDTIVFNVSMDAPFSSTSTDATLKYPHLRGIFTIGEGVIPGITLDASYDKKAISSWESLLSAENAAIQAKLNFKSGSAVISLLYKVVYDPTAVDPWVVTSGLQSAIALF